MLELKLALRGDLDAFYGSLETAALKGARQSVDHIAGFARSRLRKSLRKAGLGGPLEKSWRANVYPRQGLARRPKAFIYSKAPEIIGAFDTGPQVGARYASSLAVPIPGGVVDEQYSPPPFQRRDPVAWAEQRFGAENLFVIPAAPGRPAILAAREVGTARSGAGKGRRVDRFKRTKSGGFRQGAATVFLFFLFRSVKLPKLLDVQADFSAIEAEFRERHGRFIAAALLEAERAAEGAFRSPYGKNPYLGRRSFRSGL